MIQHTRICTYVQQARTEAGFVNDLAQGFCYYANGGINLASKTRSGLLPAAAALGYAAFFIINLNTRSTPSRACDLTTDLPPMSMF